MPIQRLFSIIFVTIILLSLSLAALLFMMYDNQEMLNHSQDNRYRSYLLADELRQSSDDLTRLARTFAVTGDPAFESQYWDILAIRNGEKPRPENYERIYWDFVAAGDARPRPATTSVSLHDLMERQGFTNAELAMLERAQANSDALVQSETIAMNAAKGRFDDGRGGFSRQGEPDFALATRLMHDSAYHNEKARIMAPVNDFLAMLDKRTGGEVAHFHQTSENFLHGMVTLVALLIVTAIAGIIGIKRKVSKVLLEFSSDAENIARGQLTVRSESHQSDEFGLLSRSFQLMVNALQSIVSNVSDSSSALSQSANRLIGSAESTRATLARQEQETVEVSAAITEMSASLREVATNSAHTADAARQADSAAANGQQVVEQTVNTINTLAQEVETAAEVIADVRHNSDNIGGILDVIRGIAEQTNLLALNAAIEAARAGEQGRGFAVVADEVRSLAKRTQDSTAEIQTMIEELQSRAQRAVDVMERSQSQARDGVAQAANAGESLGQINQSNKVISDMAMQIATAAEEQSAVIDNISQRIEVIRSLSGDTSEGSGEVSAASESLDQLARQLQEQISHFTIRQAAS